MIKFIKKIAMFVALTVGVVAPLALPSVAFAADPTTSTTVNIKDSLCAGTNLRVDATTGCDAAGSAETVNKLIASVINIFSLVVGFISVIMIIIGGLKYITSGGDASNVTGAKNTILYALIGLAVVALSQVIVHFVLGRVNA